MKQVKQHFKKF